MYEQFPEVMNMLWARMLKDNKKNWRRVYKVCHRFFILLSDWDRENEFHFYQIYWTGSSSISSGQPFFPLEHIHENNL